MTTTTAGTGVSEPLIDPLAHEEAMRLAETEYDRLIDLLRSLSADDWSRTVPDCPLWDVRKLVSHVIGNAESTARLREAARQQVKVKRRAKRTGESEIDAMTALHVEERTDMTPAQLVERLAVVARKGVAARRRLPSFVRSRQMTFPEPLGRAPIGYLIDTIYTRDTWMHRIDVCRAVGRQPVLTADHDGRLIADVVGEWARRHGRAFSLTLTGPAGGHWSSGPAGPDGEVIELDAVEFARVMSGRASGTGLLTTEVPF